MRADLAAFFHADLATLWRGKRWRTLLDLVSMLPKASRTVSALANDPEYARMVVAQLSDSEQDEPLSSLEEQTRLVCVLEDLYDLIAASLGQKGRYPRPTTMIDVERKRSTSRKAFDLISQVAPWAAN